MDMDLFSAFLLNLQRNLIELNFYFTAIQQNFKIRVNPKECVHHYLYRLYVNEKEVKSLKLLGVTYNDSKLDVATSFMDTEIQSGDTITINCEILKENGNDNIRTNYLKVITENDQGLYEGELKNDKPDGKGRFFHIMIGYVYDGEWKEGRKSGKGRFETRDGEVYVGDWENDKKNGKGKTTYPNGDIYEGDFKDGLGNGKGIIKWIDGNEYEGDIKDDKMHGKGVFRFNDGNIYEGDFFDDRREGKGIFKFKEGAVYEGEWKNNCWEGKGVFTEPNGNRYEGEFSKNKKNGFGKKIYADGKIEDGYWENDKFISDYRDDYPFSLECIKVLNNHKNSVTQLLQLKDGRLISCSKDGTLNIYNKDSFEIELSIKEHKKGLYSCSLLSDERIVTCSEDCTIKIIKLQDDNKYIVQATLDSHNGGVFKAIEVKNNVLVSVASDHLMKVWDLNEFEINKTIRNEFTDNIIKINENEFATASMNNALIKFWDSNEYKSIQTINKIVVTDCCQSMCLFNDDILLVGGFLALYSIDVKKHELINTFKMDGGIWCIKKCLDGNILCSVYNLNNNNHIMKYKYDKENLTTIFEKRRAQNNTIYNCIELSNGLIVSGEGGGKADSFEIKIWKVQEKTK